MFYEIHRTLYLSITLHVLSDTSGGGGACVVIGSIVPYRPLSVQGSHLTTAPTAIDIAVLRTYCLNALKA